MIHATRKSMEQLGEDKLEAGEKDRIESTIKELEEAMKGEDKDKIESLTTALGEASGKMAERLYAQDQGGGAADGSASSESSSQGSANAGADDVVDAEFEEVKDDKR
jgi:molecular chaperone DnaK